MPISYVYTGEPMTGTANDDFILGYQGSTGTNTNTINAGDGDDWVMADSSNTSISYASTENDSIANAGSLDSSSLWTVDENPTFGNSSTPHMTAIVEATIGQAEYFSVTVGAGQTLTVDIDYGANSPVGVPRDLVFEILNASGTILATFDDSLVGEGGLGSFPIDDNGNSRDPYGTYTAAAAGTYYIRVRPYGGGPTGVFDANNTFVLNVSVTGHAVGTPSAMGNDTIFGGNGDDSLFGQGGDDTIHGEGGNDLIHGGSGADLIYGGAGDDRIYGGGGADEVYGEGGNDTIYSSGVGQYYGGAGDDVIYAATGTPEILDGGSGVDTLDTTSWTLGYSINLETGVTNYSGESFVNFENVNTGAGADTITGTDGANVIRSGGGADKIYAKGGADTVYGGDGDDIIDGGKGADTLYGGLGDDQFYVDQLGDVVVEAAGGGNDRVLARNSYVLGVGAEIERLTTASKTGTKAIDLTGNEFDQQIVGNSGANRLDGGGGKDRLVGHGGNDTYIVDSMDDRVVEKVGGGNDRVLAKDSFKLASGQEVERLMTFSVSATTAINLTGNAFDQRIEGNAGANRLDGGGGQDRLIGYGGNDTYIVDSADDIVIEAVLGGTDRVRSKVSYALTSGSEVERLSTTKDNGTTAIDLTGNEFGQRIDGNNGANRLDGGGGRDRLYGYGGNDVLVVDSLDDVVVEAVGEGSDRVLARDTYVLTAGAEVERLSTISSSATTTINLTGNEFGQRIDGNNGANRLDGGGGADTLYGYRGDDVYIVDSLDDVVVEAVGNGNDRVLARNSYVLGAGVEVEQLSTASKGGTKTIALTGNEFGQQIVGNAGANRIAGRGGQDKLVGREGNDIFEFDSAAETGLGATRDQITDFEDYGDNDTIDLTGFAGTLSFIGDNPFSAVGQVRAIQSGSHVLVQINTTGTSGAEGEILLLNTRLSQVDATDFLL